MKTALSLIDAVPRHGATLTRLRDGRLWLTPADAVPQDLIERLRDHKAELLELVPARAGESDNTDIAWRVEAMLAQVPPRGPIRGLLTAREGAWPADGQHRVSCGDLPSVDAAPTSLLGISVRCEFCHEAAWLAISRGRAAR